MWNIDSLIARLDEIRSLAFRLTAYRRDMRYATPATVNAHKVIEMDIYNQMAERLNRLMEAHDATEAAGGIGAVGGVSGERRQVRFINGAGEELREGDDWEKHS